ncbi:MAG: hypothetical protein DMD74_11060 [Gemmatimonadetes bacterium]|nr:MAG: hypothetical protein DMD74_11060 [Gemmatimonadota bacterium]
MVPGSAATTTRSSPSSRLTRLDFPTFGRPTTATGIVSVSSCGDASGSRAATRSRRSPLLLPTAEVNRVLEGLLQRQQPPQPVGEPVRLFYASQIGTAPPRFAIVANRPESIPESYARYLVHGFREAWAFTGAPLDLKFRRKRGRG